MEDEYWEEKNGGKCFFLYLFLFCVPLIPPNSYFSNISVSPKASDNVESKSAKNNQHLCIESGLPLRSKVEEENFLKKII